jgi:hypothetical protein
MPSTRASTTATGSRSRTGRYTTPAWQKRHPSVQPRAISTAMRSNTASAKGKGELSGKG